MTRASGRKHGPRAPVVPNTPEGDYIGMSDRQSPDGSPIPGRDLHVTNPPVQETKPPVQAPKPPHRGMMAHGVPAMEGEYAHHDRAPDGPQAVPQRPGKVKEPQPVIPVPVYVVEGPNSGGRALLRAVVRRITCPAAGIDPVLVAGEDSTMKKVRILNEDATHAARWASELSNLVSGAGALVPIAPAAGQGSYLEIETQEAVYIVSNDSGNPIVSVIIEYDARGKVVK